MELNTSAVKAAAYQAHLEATRLTNLELVRDSQLMEWTNNTQEALEQLDSTDRMRFDTFWMGVFRSRQHLFVQAQEGLIRKDFVATHDAGLRGAFRSATVRDLWSRRKDQFIPDFVRHVDDIVVTNGRSQAGARDEVSPLD
jgi:hypothetical protein